MFLFWTGIFTISLACASDLNVAESPPIQFRKLPPESQPDYQRAKWDPIHFPPQIQSAADEKCLKCHGEILTRKIKSPVPRISPLPRAWYQDLATYEGSQADFHWRHLESPYAKQVLSFQCRTCHEGSDPREESGPVALRKSVDPQICLMCHGRFPFELMGLPAPWSEVREGFQNNCLICHSAIRTERHQVSYLKASNIEALAKKNPDVCWGCHGGRSWYRLSFPYPRHPWPGMPKDKPKWAKDRPTESPKRFQK